MRRAALLLVVAITAPLATPVASDAGAATADVYRSEFVARDRDGRAYVVEAMVEDRPAGMQLVLELRRRCGGCRAEVYAQTLQPGDVIVRQPSATNPGCQCMSATVTTKFGGEELRIDWAWDLEQNSGPAGDGYEWAAVTANNLANVSCFGSGTYRTTPDAFSGDEPQPPKGAKPFPKKMPRPFRADLFARPGCHAESP